MWDLIVGPVAGPLRVLVLYLIATINVFRVTCRSSPATSAGWIRYNTFASTVMLSERHNNPVMCASRLILSAVEDATRGACGRRTASPRGAGAEPRPGLPFTIE